MLEYIRAHMVPVFFVYGLSFFLLGVAVFLQSRKGSAFRLGGLLPLLGLFGLLHGVNEWLDMFLLLGREYWSPPVFTGLEISRFFIGKISYVFLFLFGAGLLRALFPSWSRVYRAGLTFYGVFIAALFAYGLFRGFDDGWFHRIDLAMRYGVAFPGSLLAGLGIWLHKDTREIRALQEDGIAFGFKSAAVLFWLYAVLAGLIVKKAPVFPADIVNSAAFMELTGFPVQLLRAACAAGLTFFVIRMLGLFELEKARRLENAYSEIIRASTHEQERIGRDIHDGLCQELSGIQLSVKALERTLAPNHPAAAEGLNRVGGLMGKAMSLSRAMARNLFPVEIEDKGLNHALADFCARISERHGVACRFRAAEGSMERDHMAANHLFRIAQEAVNNAVRHGRATLIEVVLGAADGEGLLLTVTDNGSGLPEPAVPGEGMGIKIMKYRASVLRGTLNLVNRSEGGVLVEFKR